VAGDREVVEVLGDVLAAVDLACVKGAEPPASASQSLDAYRSRLRKAFREAGANGVFVTRAPGYALEIEDTDAARFESLVRDGRAALAADEVERGVALLSEALGLWRIGAEPRPGRRFPT
jgi:DNA-binding SARP family transcriptional activator